LDWSKATVGKWRQRFIEHRIQGLYDELRPSRPRTISDEKVATLLRRTIKSKPPGGKPITTGNSQAAANAIAATR
jgi:putative transposase